MLATVGFLADLPLYHEEQPYELYGFPTKSSEVRTNCVLEDKTVSVEDVRGKEQSFTLQGCGFKFIKHTSRCDLKADHFEIAPESNSVVDCYLNETLDLVKKEFKTDRVICFDWRFRRNAPSSVPLLDVKHIRFNALPVGETTHCDFSTDGGHDRLEMHLLAEEIEAVRSGKQKVVFVNVWRPLFRVENAPLILCDRRSIKKPDLVEVDKVLPDKVEKHFFLIYREYHKWHWISNQEADEVILFLSWTPEGHRQTADYPPHGASPFNTGTKPRESVEVRVAVFLSEADDKL